uniref:Uncharacterized protein n=1 Tax=Romanomermis culicivorax TaxID=13658 RepID=A0A915HZ18_ROMCU
MSSPATTSNPAVVGAEAATGRFSVKETKKFRNERSTLMHCINFTCKCRAGSITRVPALSKTDKIPKYVWWHLPRVYDNANLLETWNKLEVDGLACPYRRFSAKRSKSSSALNSNSRKVRVDDKANIRKRQNI